MKSMLVYFMKPKGRKGPIKIGCSSGPEQRLETLSAWSPYPLEIVGTVPGGFPDESFLHRCLADDHLHREWFKATPRVIGVMQKVLEARGVETVKSEMAPAGTIRKNIRRKRTENVKLRFSYSRKVSFCEDRTRKIQRDRWKAPDDIHRILNTWRGYRYWNEDKKEFVRVPPTAPSGDQLKQIDRYLADPLSLSVVPSWERRTKDSICIPVFVEATPDEMAPAVSRAPINPSAAGANLHRSAACLS
jgi:hypothetical protein